MEMSKLSPASADAANLCCCLIYIQSAFQMETEQKITSEISSLLLAKDFFKKIVIRMDIPHNYYDENGIYHCNLTDFLLGRVDIL